MARRKHRERSSLAESKDEAMQEENVDPKKAKKPTMKKEVDTFTCKKTDGKQWRCKRPSHQSNSYCDYHLAQLQSYSYRARAPGHGGHGRRPRRWKRVMMDSDVYYCSAFGAWRSGKHRDGGSFIAATHVQEHETDDDDDNEKDDEDDDSSYDEHDPLSINARKRMWKPVKSRSLNSLF